MKERTKDSLIHMVELIVMSGMLTIILYANASHFDETEVRTIMLMIASIIGFKAIAYRRRRCD